MKLTDALKINQSAQSREGHDPLHTALCCGFTSLQLEQFLAAHLHNRITDRIAEIQPPTYGDAIGALDQINKDCEAIFLIVEWQDLDPRLGIRQADWRASLVGDILQTACLRLELLVDKLSSAASHAPVYVSLPQLPTPSLLPSAKIRQDPFRTDLECLVLDTCQKLLVIQGVSILAKESLSSSTSAYDLKNDIRFGSPYSIEFLSTLTGQLVDLAFPSTPPLKGLITDLDDSLWRGIIGDSGVDKINWNLDNHSLMHAVYQQKLQALAEQGVLLAIASKNDSAIAQSGLSRTDLRVDAKLFFPQEIHWGEKSESISKILKIWNIAADSVLFIDDSAAELAEVQSVHPQILTRQFPTKDDLGVLELVRELGDLFTKDEISKEDRLRSTSIRQQALASEELGSHQADPAEFLRQLNSKVCIEVSTRDDPRAFELINKTNQFNLNGNRLVPKEWLNLQNDESTVMLTVEYEDKFGKLGKIAVLIGTRNGSTLDVTSWILSCRAFSRRIEHLCLQILFDQLQFETVQLHYKKTDRNEPIARLIASFSQQPLSGKITLEKKTFFDYCPPLYHSLQYIHDA
ncbi:MAG: HAD-IIIC family phosphatase [Verrucomicrobiales bacterium]|nr:HAD-IIIC family phosphatase [Verrucomicrobiales bacterium]